MRYLLHILPIVLLLSCSDSNTKTPQAQQPHQDVTSTPISDSSDRPSQTIAEKPATDSTYLIVPGQRVGQVRLGQTAEQVNSKLGQPDSGDAAMGKAMAYWFSKNKNRSSHVVAVYFSRNYTDGPDNLYVRQVRVNSPSFKTPESLGAGSHIATIRQHYTIEPFAYYDAKQRIYIFDDTAQGIAFEIAAPDSSCVAVTIHKAGEDVTNSYLPMHPDLTRL